MNIWNKLFDLFHIKVRLLSFGYYSHMRQFLTWIKKNVKKDFQMPLPIYNRAYKTLQK